MPWPTPNRCFIRPFVNTAKGRKESTREALDRRSVSVESLVELRASFKKESDQRFRGNELKGQLMKTWAYLFLAAGFVLLLMSIFMWETDHRNVPQKLPYLLFPFIPAWSLLIMAWTGLVAENVFKRFRE